jgi:hypothetical protein
LSKNHYASRHLWNQLQILSVATEGRRSDERPAFQHACITAIETAASQRFPTRVAQSEGAELSMLKGAPAHSDEIFLVYRVENKNVRAIQALSQEIQKASFAGR